MKNPHVGYNETFQYRNREPDAYENMVGDALEDAFKRKIHDLDGIVTVLRERDVPVAGGGEWSAELLAKELARLGE